MKGHFVSELTKEKIKKTLWKGGKPKCLVCNKLLSTYSAKHCKKHRPHTLQMRLNKSKACRRGERNNMWKGGITPVNHKIRSSLEMKLWRKAVFKRDNWTCVWCRQRGGNLEADHKIGRAHV